MAVHFGRMPIDDWQREMERYLAHFSRTGKRPRIVFSPYAQWMPAVDMYETDTEIVAVFDLAGVDATQTEVRAEAHALTVRGVRRERRSTQSPGENCTYHALEIAYGRFERVLHLPPSVDTSAAEASYNDGLLEVRLPKRVPHHVSIGVQRPETAATDD